MGVSQSTPQPLIEIKAPNGKILVPSGSSFTVDHPAYPRVPIYKECASSRRGNGRLPHPRARRGFKGPGYGGGGRRRPDLEILEGSEDSESTLTESMGGMSPRGVRRQGGMGGTGGLGRRGGPGYFDGMDRPRSAPDGLMGRYPGMGMPKGMPGSPRMGMNGMGGMGGMGPGGMGGMGGMGPGGMGPGGMGGMGPGGMGGMGNGGMGPMRGMPPSGMPPEYTTNPSMPQFNAGMGGGGMPAPGMNPYANYPGHPPSPPESRIAIPPQQPRRSSGKPQGDYERIPMGAYTKTEKPRKPSRSRTEPLTSTLLNRGQPSNRHVGPSGQEWIKGDGFLDACLCTTGCKCRKSQRVLYRSRNDRGKGSDSEDEQQEYQSGEIRYVLKDDLGRDCGDHSSCRKSQSESEKEEKSKKSKDKKEKKKRKEQFEGFKDDILEALDERFEDMKKESQQRGKASSTPHFAGPGMGPSPFMMGEPNMDPRIAQQMGMVGGDAYGMNNMNIPTSKHPMRPQGMQMGAMAGRGMGFEDDMSMSMDDMGARNMGNPYMPGMINKKAMRPDFLSPQRPKAGAKFGDMDQMALYARAMRGGRGSMMRGRGGGGGGGRRSHFDSESDDFDRQPQRRPNMRRRGGGGGGQDTFGSRTGGGNEDDEFPTTRRLGSSPIGGMRNGRRSSLDRDKQARVNTDDDEEY